MRVYDLAKEINMSSKELADIMKSMGIPVKNHMSALTAQQEKYFRNNFTIEKYKSGELSIEKKKEEIAEAKKQKTIDTKKVSKQDSTQGAKAEGKKINAKKTFEQNKNIDQNRKQKPQGYTKPAYNKNNNASVGNNNAEAKRENKGQNNFKKDGRKYPSNRKDFTVQNKDFANKDRNDRSDRFDNKKNDNRRNQRGNFSKDNKSMPSEELGMATKNKDRRDRRDSKKDERRKKEDREFGPIKLIDNSKKTKGSKASYKNKKKEAVSEVTISEITIPSNLTVGDLAEQIKKPATELVRLLMGYGIMAGVNQNIDFETAGILCEEFGITAIEETEEDLIERILEEHFKDESKLKKRPPIITVMGHVDHGKTSLLDAIRHTNVIAGEAGGITQHIGAYTINVNGEEITFIDTPGHEAFTAMRYRGASVTDIAVLVVAADDGVMPQTIEAINHAKAANVPIIVAVNKIDKPSANPDKVKQELTEYGLVSEDWGGDTIFVNVSALQKQGINELLDMILLVAEVGELKANPDMRAVGTVIEARLDKQRGSTATLLIKSGTLKEGDIIVAGAIFGHIRAMSDDSGKKLKIAGPSNAVEIIGLNEVPSAGDKFFVPESEKDARKITEQRKNKLKADALKKHGTVSLEDLFNQISQGELKELNLIVKADVQGSFEALKQSLEKLNNNDDGVKVSVIHGGVGAVTETDVTLAAASNAIIIGFNVRPDANAQSAADKEGVEIRNYRVIYNVIEEIEQAMKGLLDPEFREVSCGTAEVRQTFKVPGVGIIGGCYVTNGVISRKDSIRVLRDSVVVFEGEIASLKRVKDDVKEVNSGFECGIGIDKFNDIKEGDIFETFRLEEIPRD